MVDGAERLHSMIFLTMRIECQASHVLPTGTSLPKNSRKAQWSDQDEKPFSRRSAAKHPVPAVVCHLRWRIATGRANTSGLRVAVFSVLLSSLGTAHAIGDCLSFRIPEDTNWFAELLKILSHANFACGSPGLGYGDLNN